MARERSAATWSYRSLKLLICFLPGTPGRPLVFFAAIITHPAPNAKRRFTAADCTNIAAGRKKISCRRSPVSLCKRQKCCYNDFVWKLGFWRPHAGRGDFQKERKLRYDSTRQRDQGVHRLVQPRPGGHDLQEPRHLPGQEHGHGVCRRRVLHLHQRARPRRGCVHRAEHLQAGQ